MTIPIGSGCQSVDLTNQPITCSSFKGQSGTDQISAFIKLHIDTVTLRLHGCTKYKNPIPKYARAREHHPYAEV